MKTKCINFCLPADEAAALKRHCKKLGVTVSFFLRRLIRENVPELRERYSKKMRIPGSL